MLEHIPTDNPPSTACRGYPHRSSGGTPIRIVVTIDEAKLRSRVAAATLATGERISAGELRRLACNHDILPLVLGGDSMPIDLGRASRLFSKEQRDALAVMDGTRHALPSVALTRGAPVRTAGRLSGYRPTWYPTNGWAQPGSRAVCRTGGTRIERERSERGPGNINRGKGRGWELNHRYRP